MDERTKAIRALHDRIEALASQQKHMQDEIVRLQNALFDLEIAGIETKPATEATTRPEPPPPQAVIGNELQRSAPPEITNTERAPEKMAVPSTPPRQKHGATPLEDFIGKNLLNKIGIAVLVAGVAFGTKYSIDNNLIDPVARVIMGYFWGIVLNVVAIRVRRSHENFSAVLLSGGMAVLYFVTFFAYDFYDLIPQPPTFALMVVFTAFTVFAAIRYNRQVIGIFGLVGAYAVPFLLSDGSGRVVILFSYITVINAGILILAFRKYWDTLYYAAFILTWLVYIAWFAFDFSATKHLTLALAFSTIFFTTFYAMFLSYKLIRRAPLAKADLTFMLLNSFLYFGFGIAALDSWSGGDDYLGLFTVFNALIHFLACALIYRQRSHTRDVFFFVAGMVLVFLTMAVPIQLDGNWVTFIWAAESLILFWIGRSKRFPVYEKLSYPLMALTVMSLAHDWSLSYPGTYGYTYGSFEPITFFLNIHFLTSVFVTVCLGGMVAVHRRDVQPDGKQQRLAGPGLSYILSLSAVVVVYLGIYLEIDNYFNQWYGASGVTVSAGEQVEKLFDHHLLMFRTLWLIYFSAVFMLGMEMIRRFFRPERNVMVLNLFLNGAVIFTFLTSGLLELADLRAAYIHESNDPYFERGPWYILIRYVGVLFVAPLIYINHRYLQNDAFQSQHRQVGAVLFHITLLVLLSSELVHWLELAGVVETFKLGLSILWSVYAFGLIVFGLRRDRKHLRVLAITLFAVTLVKLFFYDMADLSTIYKTIVMIILGVLLLVASFLYNKLKKNTDDEIA